MKGIVLAGGSGTRLHPLTLSISKQLLPVYDKPMVYYPISTLMLAGIKDILIISTPNDICNYENLLGDGSQFGINFSYKIQEKPEGIAQAFILAEEFCKNEDVCLILGDNIFYGIGFNKLLLDSIETVKKNQAVIFGSFVKDPERYGVVEFDKNNNVVCIEEKPAEPKTNYAVAGLYFYPKDVNDYAKKVKPSDRGELEITSINQMYLDDNRIKLTKLSRGFAWLDTGTHESLANATEFVKVIEHRTGLKIACLEEIAWRMGYLELEDIKNNVKNLKGDYYDYINNLK